MYRLGLRGGILLLERRVAAIQESLRVLLHHLPDPRRLHDVDPMTDDGHAVHIRYGGPERQEAANAQATTASSFARLGSLTLSPASD